MPEVLKAPLVVEFPFTRSLGPVQSAFLTGLRERVVLGVKAADGRTLVPPVEYDRHRGGPGRARRGRPHRHRHHLGLEPRTPSGPTPRHPLRLGPGPARRRGHRPSARPGRAGPRGRTHRDARACPLGGAAHRRHHRHRLLRAVRRRPPAARGSRRAVRGHGHRHRRSRAPRLRLLARPRPVRLHQQPPRGAPWASASRPAARCTSAEGRVPGLQMSSHQEQVEVSAAP